MPLYLGCGCGYSPGTEGFARVRSRGNLVHDFPRRELSARIISTPTTILTGFFVVGLVDDELMNDDDDEAEMRMFIAIQPPARPPPVDQLLFSVTRRVTV